MYSRGQTDGQASGGYRDLQHGSALSVPFPAGLKGGPGSAGGLTRGDVGPGGGVIPLMTATHAACTSCDPEAPGPANATGKQNCLDVAFLTQEEQGHWMQAGLSSLLAQAQICSGRPVMGNPWV